MDASQRKGSALNAKIKKVGNKEIISKSNPQQLCKVSQYVKAEGDKGNATLKMMVNDVKNLAILTQERE